MECGEMSLKYIVHHLIQSDVFQGKNKCTAVAIFVTGFERTHLPRTQQEDILTITQ